MVSPAARQGWEEPKERRRGDVAASEDEGARYGQHGATAERACKAGAICLGLFTPGLLL